MSRLPEMDPTAIYTGAPTPLSSKRFHSLNLQQHSYPNYFNIKFVHLQSHFQSNPHISTFRASSSRADATQSSSSSPQRSNCVQIARLCGNVLCFSGAAAAIGPPGVHRRSGPLGLPHLKEPQGRDIWMNGINLW